jgi:tRNA (cytidine/uridine-2'-O-)-methyltransferase
VTGSSLILVRPLGFSISDKALKRAGLDYWDGVDVEIIDDLMIYLKNTKTPFYFLSSHAKKVYSDIQYTCSDTLIFGSETAGLPSIYHESFPEQFLRVPMIENSRCLNLSNTVSIVLYEAWRQQSFIM